MLQFSKYQGLGNDFLLLDGRGADPGDQDLGLTRDRVQRLCDRRFGVGGDGVILALPAREGGELRMRIFNADGSEPEMCGNGIRCLARFLADSDGDGPGRSWQVETLAGRIVPRLEANGEIRVDMGPPFLEPDLIPTTLPIGSQGIPEGELEVAGMRFAVGAAGMGNPHVVIPVQELEAVDLERFGSALEVHPAFPARTNVHFVEVLSPTHLRLKVWERGAGPTLACGTGACATLVVCHRFGLCDAEARLDLPGGSLQIHWDDKSQHVFMTGPAAAVFDGVVAPALLESADAQIPVNPSASGAMASGSAASPEPADRSGPEQQSSISLDCAKACVNGCQRPQNCPNAEARARVQALLEATSLDDLVSLATQTLEARTRARLEKDLGRGG